MKITSSPSPHWNERKHDINGIKGVPSMIIAHHTGDHETEYAIKLLSGKEEKSAHYLINKEGHIYQLVDEKKRAYHAGGSVFTNRAGKLFSNDVADVNSWSIGIEMIGCMELDYTEVQIDAFKWLCKDIQARYPNIKARDIFGHSDASLARRFDPGHKFPWKELAKEGIGIWPDTSKLRDNFNYAAFARDKEKVKELIIANGYNIGECGSVIRQQWQKASRTAAPTFKEMVRGINRHWVPELFNEDGSGDAANKVTATTVRRLMALRDNKIVKVEKEPIVVTNEMPKRVAGMWG